MDRQAHTEENVDCKKGRVAVLILDKVCLRINNITTQNSGHFCNYKSIIKGS